jgi:hypothetical protein
MGKKMGAHRIFMGRHKGMRPFGIPRSRYEGDIKLDLQ